jgi:hypothetical protein
MKQLCALMGVGFFVLAGMPCLARAEAVEHVVHQVKLRCEGEFRSAARFQRTADTQPGNPVRKMSSDICVHEGMEITIARTEYMPETKMDLKGFVKQSAAALGRRAGVTNPMQSTAAVKVSSMPAERMSFSARLNAKPVTVESLYFLKDQTLWTVQIVFETGEERRTQAERILSGVRYQAEP